MSVLLKVTFGDQTASRCMHLSSQPLRSPLCKLLEASGGLGLKTDTYECAIPPQMVEFVKKYQQHNKETRVPVLSLERSLFPTMPSFSDHFHQGPREGPSTTRSGSRSVRRQQIRSKSLPPHPPNTHSLGEAHVRTHRDL